MDDTDLVRRRDHRLAPDRLVMTEELALDYPVREEQVRDDWDEVTEDHNVAIRTGGEPVHVIVEDDRYGLRTHGWNQRLAIEQLLRARYEIDYSIDDTPPEIIRQQVDVYSEPAWENQILEKAEGEYTDSIMLTHFEQLSSLVPVEWVGMSADGEPVYFRYRGGTLQVYVGDVEARELAYRKQIGRFPDASLSTEELFSHLPPWIGHIGNLDRVPDRIIDQFSQQEAFSEPATEHYIGSVEHQSDSHR